MNGGRQIYLDHAATTAVDPAVLDAMMPYFREDFGNSSSSHAFGRAAERAVDEARETVAAVLGCRPHEIVFTSGGTESDNLALRGAAAASKGRRFRLITTPVEHNAVSRTARLISELGAFEAVMLPVDHFGMVEPELAAQAIDDDTVLVSVMLANNEVGSIQPVRAIADVAHSRGALMHTDAVQAAGQLSLNVDELGVDMLSMSAHKFYGPKGAGALYIRDGVTLLPSQSGGSHEDGRRAGTLNTPGIVGLAVSLKLAYDRLAEHTAHCAHLRDVLIERILAQTPGAELTGHPTRRLPNHASFVFDGIDGNRLLMHLDTLGVAASSGSACKTGNPEPSAVLLAMGFSRETAVGSLRLTVGKDTTEQDVCEAADAVAAAVTRLRAVDGVSVV